MITAGHYAVSAGVNDIIVRQNPVARKGWGYYYIISPAVSVIRMGKSLTAKIKSVYHYMVSLLNFSVKQTERFHKAFKLAGFKILQNVQNCKIFARDGIICKIFCLKWALTAAFICCLNRGLLNMDKI